MECSNLYFKIPLSVKCCIYFSVYLQRKYCFISEHVGALYLHIKPKLANNVSEILVSNIKSIVIVKNDQNPNS